MARGQRTFATAATSYNSSIAPVMGKLWTISPVRRSITSNPQCGSVDFRSEHYQAQVRKRFYCAAGEKAESPTTAKSLIKLKPRVYPGHRQNGSNFPTQTIINESGTSSEAETEKEELKGKLILDATVADQSICYPTDVSLLNEGREFSEQIQDYLYLYW